MYILSRKWTGKKVKKMTIGKGNYEKMSELENSSVIETDDGAADTPVFTILKNTLETPGDGIHLLEIKCWKYEAILYYFGDYVKDRDEGTFSIRNLSMHVTASKFTQLFPDIFSDGIYLRPEISIYTIPEMDFILEKIHEDLELARALEQLVLEYFPCLYVPVYRFSI